MGSYSKTIANQIEQCLRDNGWEFEFYDTALDKGAVFVVKPGVPYPTTMIQVSTELFTLHTPFPTEICCEDREKVRDLAELFNRMNGFLENGSFVFNRKDGKVFFRYGIECAGMVPDKKVIEKSVTLQACMIYTYGAVIDEVISGETSVEDAIAKLEDD